MIESSIELWRRMLTSIAVATASTVASSSTTVTSSTTWTPSGKSAATWRASSRLERGLPDAARTDEGVQAVLGHGVDELTEQLVATDERLHGGRQGVGPVVGRRRARSGGTVDAPRRRR